MQFVDIQNAVISGTFDETDRPDIKNWINGRGSLLWDIDEWSFRRASANVTVTAGSNLITGLPADFQIATDVFRDDGFKLKMFEEYREFASIYLGIDNTWNGPPEAATVLGTNEMLVGPVSNETSSTYLLAYERGWTTLVNDSDEPLLPNEGLMALVFAAKADGMVLRNILLNEPLEQRYQEYLQVMQRNYITAVRGEGHQTPAYRPGGAYSGRWLEP